MSDGVFIFCLCVATLLGALYPLLFKRNKPVAPKEGWKKFEDEHD